MCWLRVLLVLASLLLSEALEPTGAYPGFCSMERLGVFLLPLNEMLAYRRSLPRNLLGFPNNSPVYPFILLGGERHCESKVSCPRAQHMSPARARPRTARSGDECINHEATAPLLLPPLQGRKKPRSDFPGQVNCALRQVQIEVWWSAGQVKLASVVLLVIVSNQKQKLHKVKTARSRWVERMD